MSAPHLPLHGPQNLRTAPHAQKTLLNGWIGSVKPQLPRVKPMSGVSPAGTEEGAGLASLPLLFAFLLQAFQNSCQSPLALLAFVCCSCF